MISIEGKYMPSLCHSNQTNIIKGLKDKELKWWKNRIQQVASNFVTLYQLTYFPEQLNIQCLCSIRGVKSNKQKNSIWLFIV